MAVLRLSDSSLLVHSPVALDSALEAALACLGPVRHIVSPNYEHIAYAAQVCSGFPSPRPPSKSAVRRSAALHVTVHHTCRLRSAR